MRGPGAGCSPWQLIWNWWEDSCTLFHSLGEPSVSFTPVLAQVKLSSNHNYHSYYFKLVAGWM